jgi:DNA (cytosine-5)-methyltransferase 1
VRYSVSRYMNNVTVGKNLSSKAAIRSTAPPPDRASNGFKAVSLFSGAGGIDVGVREAGFSVLACVEKDPNCCETLRFAAERENLSTRVFEMDIRTLDPNHLMKELGIQPQQLDLLCGGPPCQAFSQIGKQQSIHDERGLLLFEMIRFAEAIRPKAILLEQVKGLLNARGVTETPGEVFVHFLSELDRLGYVPKWSVLNAADYGVAQTRKRVFVVATRKPNGFVFPAVTNVPDKDVSPLFSMPPYKTAGQAIGKLSLAVRKGEITADLNHIDVTPNGDKGRITGVPEGEFLAGQLHLPAKQRGRLTKKDTTKYLRVSRERPANTLRCGEIFFHPTENRYLTPREYMLLHGYPKDYHLCGPIRSRSGRVQELDQHRQVANSVPPPVAKALAEEIVKVLNAHNF